MRLLPQSLFGRLVLILALGLILAQILSTALTFHDRGKILQDNLGLQVIQRIASIVTLLEETPRPQRQKIVRALDSRTFRISLGDSPLAAIDSARPSAHLLRLLQQQLPTDTPVRVAIVPLPFGPGSRPPREEMYRHSNRRDRDDRSSPPFVRDTRHWPDRRVFGFQAQVQLSDGQWINFHRPMPEEVFEWPKRLLGYLLLLLVSVVTLSLLAVRLVTRPLNTLAQAATDLGKDIQRPPLDESGPTEVRKAAIAFNTMQRRLRRYIEDRSQVLAAVSHDLKTPITRLRLRTELLKDPEQQEKFAQDLDEMEQMVLATLDYLRGTESKEKPAPIDIQALLESIQDDMTELGWDVEIEESPAIPPYPGRPMALKRCLSNLLENAVRYGQRARIRIEDSSRQLVLIIGDDGPGIGEEALETLFNPFYRREESRSKTTGGTGLGLGIARNIARAHGGDVILRPGKTLGLEAVVTLPR